MVHRQGLTLLMRHTRTRPLIGVVHSSCYSAQACARSLPNMQRRTAH